MHACMHVCMYVCMCSPSTSPVPEAVGRKFLFGPLAEEGLVGAGRNRSEADQTGPDRRSADFCIGPEIQKTFELQLDHSRGTGQ